MRLIDKDSEPVTLRFSPTCSLLIRPLGHERVTELRDKYLAAGQKDSVPFRRALFAEALVDWEGLETSKGAPQPFDAAKAGAVGLALPDLPALRAIGVIRTGVDEVEDAAGN